MIYLAGPFFNREQEEVCMKVEAMCQQLDLDYYSPRHFMVLPKDAHRLTAEKVFNENKARIKNSDLMLANIEGFDVGTVWEMGFAHEAGVATVAYSFVPGRKLNVMIQCGVKGFANSREQIFDFLNVKRSQPWNYKVLSQWEGAVE